jgi:hypothetical protein
LKGAAARAAAGGGTSYYLGVWDCMSAAHAGSAPCVANNAAAAVGVYAGRPLNGLIALVQSPAGSTYNAINNDGTVGTSLGAMTPVDLATDAWYAAATPIVGGVAAYMFAASSGGAQLGTAGASIVAAQPCNVGCHNMSYAYRATNALVAAFKAVGSTWPAGLASVTDVENVVYAMVVTLTDVAGNDDPAAYWVTANDWVSVRQCQASINRVHTMCRSGSLGPATGRG